MKSLFVALFALPGLAHAASAELRPINDAGTRYALTIRGETARKIYNGLGAAPTDDGSGRAGFTKRVPGTTCYDDGAAGAVYARCDILVTTP